jgi:carboxymethylenebutenolidase
MGNSITMDWSDYDASFFSENPFEPIIYEGAGHGFFRSGENQNATEANRLAREQGIQRLKEILRGL